jgi:hypothetical protein
MGMSPGEVARAAGRAEGLVADEQGVSDVVRTVGLSRTGSVRQLRDLPSLVSHVRSYSTDDEYLIALTTPGGNHVVHGFWNGAGEFILHDAQQARNVSMVEAANGLPIRAWRAPAARIHYIVNDVNPNDPVDILTYRFGLMRLE